MSNVDSENILSERFAELHKVLVASVEFQQNTRLILLSLRDLILQEHTAKVHASHPNPLNRFGCKCFSQADEDGITMEIVKRLGIDKGVYAEFGVGTGIENNTLILAALGWTGYWVGGEYLEFNYSQATKFAYVKDWITLENIVQHAELGLKMIDADKADVVSLDLDGNDIYFVEKLLSNGTVPKLFIVEYNGKFPPPVKFQIAYDPDHRWFGDDYFGAALTNYVELFYRFGYQLICCNAQTGANAFFIHSDFSHLFADIPSDIKDIYVAPRYHLYSKYGHKPSSKVVEAIINH